ncbi:MAG: hypothetical protein WDO71_21700 [Bacteroidota bacterium]
MGSTLLAVSYFRSIKRTDMYQELYAYLILHRQLNVPGIGTFLVERKPAETEFTHKQINHLHILLYCNREMQLLQSVFLIGYRISLLFLTTKLLFNSTGLPLI